MSEPKKVGTKGRHAKIPEGYEIVESGNAQKGDKFIHVESGTPWPCEDDDIGMPFDSFDCLIRPKPFPRHWLHKANFQLVAVTPNIQNAPAYKGVSVMTVEEMREKAEEIKGYVMQQDDGMTSPFRLYHFTD